MVVENKEVLTRVVVSLPPGVETELDTPAGPIKVIGGDENFSLRRIGAEDSHNDIVYYGDRSLTINHKDGTQSVVRAVKKFPTAS